MKGIRLLCSEFLLLMFGLCTLYLGNLGTCIAAELGFEAENADEFVPIMDIFEDENASGGMYISAGQGGGGRHPGKADFQINILTPGEYTIWGRVLPLTTAKDSLHVTIDEQKSPQPGDAEKIWDTGQYAEWTWVKVIWREKDPLTFDLKPGKHTLTIWSREGDTRLDAIFMSTDPNANPQLPENVDLPVNPKGNLTTTWAAVKKP